MNVTPVIVLCSSSTFMGHLHFCPGDIPFFIQTPPLRMTGFQMGGGGSDFFSRKPTIFWPFGQIFQRCRHAKKEPFRFHFPKGRDKNLKLQFLVILRGVGGGEGVPCGSPRAIFPTPISHSMTLSQNLTNWYDLYWRKIIVSTMISWFLTKRGTKFRSSKDAMTSYMYTT